MKKILLAALCLLFVTAMYSQDMALADSLKRNLETQPQLPQRSDGLDSFLHR